jgi:hypothetical protein
VSLDPLDGVQVGPVTVARLDGVPFASPILESAAPHHEVGAVLGVSGPLDMNHPEAVLWRQGEGFGVMLHKATLFGRGDVPPTKRLFRMPWAGPVVVPVFRRFRAFRARDLAPATAGRGGLSGY